MKRKAIIFTKLIIVLGILLGLELTLADSNFNLEINIPEDYKSIRDGGELHFSTKVLNLENQERMDISLTYEVLNKKNNSIVSKTETMAIETQASFVGSLTIPKGTKKGEYTLRVTLNTNNSEKFAQDMVFVEDNNLIRYVYLGLGIVFLVILVLFAVKKSKKLYEKIELDARIDKIVKNRSKS